MTRPALTPAQRNKAYRERQAAKMRRYEEALRLISEASPLSTAAALSDIAEQALEDKA